MINRQRSNNWVIILVLFLIAGCTFWLFFFVSQNNNQPLKGTLQSTSIFLKKSSERLSSSADNIIIVGGEEDNPPFSYWVDGIAQGLNNDLMRAVAKNLDMEIEFKLTSFDEAQENLTKGEIDLIAGIPESYPISKSVLIGTPYAFLTYDLFVNEESDIRSIKDLQNKSYSVLASSSTKMFLSHLVDPAQIHIVDKPEMAMSLINSGAYDAALVTQIQGNYWIKQNHLENIMDIGHISSSENYGFAVLQENSNLVQKINREIDLLEANGTLKEINDKWLSQYQLDTNTKNKSFLIYGFLIFTCSALIFILAWFIGKKATGPKPSGSQNDDQKYKELIDNAAEGIAIISEYKIVFMNPRAGTIIGLKEKTTRNLPDFMQYVHPLDQELLTKIYQQFIAGSQINLQIPIRLVKNKNEITWIKANIINVIWDERPSLLICFTDISAEKLLEDEIKTSEERFRLVFYHSPVGYFSFNNKLEITNANDRFFEIMGLTPGPDRAFYLPNINNKNFLAAIRSSIHGKNSLFEGWINTDVENEGKKIYVKLQTTPSIDENKGGIGVIEDFTDRLHNKNRIQNLEDRLSKTISSSMNAIAIANIGTGKFVEVNQGFLDLSGYSKEEVIGNTALNLGIWVNKKDLEKFIKLIQEDGGFQQLEVVFRNKNGKKHYVLITASVIDVEGEKCIMTVSRIIDELKENEQQIRDSERRYRTIFESVPVSIWEQDLTIVYDMLEELRRSGVDDLSGYLDSHPEFVELAIKSINVIEVNQASFEIYKSQTKEELLFSLDKIFTEESNINFKKELVSIWNHETFFSGDTVNLDLEGNPIFVNVAMQIPETREGFSSVLVCITDITQRKSAEDALIESESRFRQLVEQVNIVVYLDYATLPSKPKYISPQIRSLLGYTQEEWMANPDLMMKIIHPDDLQFVIDADIETDKSGEPFVVEYRAFTKTGEMIWIHDEAILVFDQNGNPDDWHGVMYDITARKLAEQALRESENRYRSIFNAVPVSIKEEDFSQLFNMFEELRNTGVTDLDEFIETHPEWIRNAVKKISITEVNMETLQMYKADSKEQLLKSLDHFFTEDSYPSFKNELLAFWNNQTSYVQETKNRTIDGETIDVWISIAIPTGGKESYSRVLVTILDITERKKAEEQIRIQLRYLAALHAVDMAISASMDLPITLRVLINQVHQQLFVDAVSILILDPHTQTLKYSAGIGFKTSIIEKTNLRLGQSYAGQAALERKIITADNLQSPQSLLHTKDFDQEEFTHYLGIPLISKGIVKGVLELFKRNPFTQEASWMVLLESLAGQAAIAIENAFLMDEVQKVNLNLRSAYDATIEGWAKSIDIRNGDSEEHSKHIADLAVELAQSAGLHGEGLLSLRHGALLHDIGKLAVPENILLKPGPLTAEEWTVMKTHPLAAKSLLNSIEFLHDALEIPYGHHERWDGTGYPQGLKGEEIPFSARIFSVVDCWESLRSDRPWRKAWTDGNALDYIENNAGKAFDPYVVDKFKQMIGHNFSTYF